MRISDWSSDVCSSDLGDLLAFRQEFGKANLTSLVERCSRFTILARNPSPPFGRCHGWHRQAVENLAPFPPAKHHLRPWDRICGFSDPASEARHGQLFLHAVSKIGRAHV